MVAGSDDGVAGFHVAEVAARLGRLRRFDRDLTGTPVNPLTPAVRGQGRAASDQQQSPRNRCDQSPISTSVTRRRSVRTKAVCSFQRTE